MFVLNVKNKIPLLKKSPLVRVIKQKKSKVVFIGNFGFNAIAWDNMATAR